MPSRQGVHVFSASVLVMSLSSNSPSRQQPAGEVYAAVEAPKGEFGVYLISAAGDGSSIDLPEHDVKRADDRRDVCKQVQRRSGGCDRQLPFLNSHWPSRQLWRPVHRRSAPPASPGHLDAEAAELAAGVPECRGSYLDPCSSNPDQKPASMP
jgi:hypothetical protein